MNASKMIAACQILLLIFATTSHGVQAAMIGTGDFVAQQSARASHIAVIEAALSREDIAQQLVAHGVSYSDAMHRIAGLTDSELRQLAGRMEQLPAGGSSVIAVIGITFIVLIILELTGVIDVFTAF